MKDPILTSRIAALDADLMRIGQCDTWFGQVLRSVETPDDLWQMIKKTIGGQVRVLKRRLGEVQTALESASLEDEDAMAAAWKAFSDIQEQSQTVFQESLELITGLAFREWGIDNKIAQQQIWQVSDELIRACAKQSANYTWQSVTVPASTEALTKTLARIIRLRFPEWSIWYLPFTAHELGHVLADEDADFHPFIAEVVGQWLTNDPELQAVLKGDAISEITRSHIMERVKRRVTNHVNDFFADAFATYIMGPAYACAAIYLRFNPSQPFNMDDEHPADANRAHIIFSVLEKMNREAGRLSQPYTVIIDKLKNDWTSMLKRARPEGETSPREVEMLQDLADRIWKDQLDMWVLPGGMYPSTGKDGWNAAKELGDTWSKRIDQPQELYVATEPPPLNQLRDVLNAAWFCRGLIDDPALFRYVSLAAHLLCQDIINARRSAYGRRITPPEIDKGVTSREGR